ncbi:MAG: hypothetical protein NTU98_05730 [Bacteroidetes bacterium]|nr:hypothetical protein [Bacteroidota bacterium]
MKNSSSRSLLLILLLWTGLSSPAVCQSKGYVPGKGPWTTAVFDSSFVKALYKGTFDISKTHLTGLFMIKRSASNSIRIVFSNEFGMTFFDFEYRGDEFIVHYCYPSFEKHSLPKILESDFRLLLVPDTTVTRMKRLGSKDPELVIFGVKSARGSFHYTYDHDSGKIRRMQSSHSIIGRADLRLYGDKGTAPNKIYLYNPTIRLHIKLTFLSN